MHQYNQEQKIDLLKTVYDQVHKSRRDKESLERKVSFGASALFLGLASLRIKGSFNIPEGNEWKMLMAILMVMGMTVAILILNAKTIQQWCRMIVRIEQIFGLYDSTIYISKEKVSLFNKIPSEDDTVFPEKVMHWGGGGRLQSINIHIVIVVLTSIIAMVSVCV